MKSETGQDGEPGRGLATWWLARGEDQLPGTIDWLSAAECRRVGLLQYTKRQTDFLLGRRTLKLAVAKVLGWPAVPPVLARIEPRPAPSGAPRLFIDNQPVSYGVSLTDRAGCAVCLVATQSVAIGCDVEVVEPRSDAFVRDYLTQAEQDLVGAAGAARDIAANLVWSAKESALKVLGTGLRRDTRSVEVTVTGLNSPECAWSAMHIRLAEGTVLHGWWRRSGAFLITSCWPAGGPPPGTLEKSSPIDTLLPSHRWMSRPVS